MVGRDRIATVVTRESVRRAIKRASADIDRGVVEVDVYSNGDISPEEVRRMAALNIAILRLTDAARMN